MVEVNYNIEEVSLQQDLYIRLAGEQFYSYISKNASGEFSTLNRSEKNKQKHSGIYPETVWNLSRYGSFL